MPNLGNAWHIPGGSEPRGWAGMRDPVGAIVPGATITILSGNQFQGVGGNPGNQLQDGSALFFRRAADVDWTRVPSMFHRVADNNKYYAATITAAVSQAFRAGEAIRYYLRVAYDDHDTTFVHAQGDASAVTGDETAARAAAFTLVVEAAERRGRWGPVFTLPNVAIHAHVLPNGKVLMWGRRDLPSQSLDVHACTPFVWDPATRASSATPQPKRADGTTVNLFCSGHAFLPDGRLLVAGGHLFDGDGTDQASIYDWKTNTWTPTAPMGAALGRWYPTATALPSGGVLVLSGSHVDPARPPGKQNVVVDVPQVWEQGTWKTIRQADGTPLSFVGLPLYPRVHVSSDGSAFMSGTNALAQRLKVGPPGEWRPVDSRAMGLRDYCPAVMYDVDKIVYIGGGNDAGTHAPTAEVEVIDLGQAQPRWQKTRAMTFPRRQHNATLLPDGTVLVTGGTRGGGGTNIGFNDLTAGQPVHVAELWSPATGQWTPLAAESVDRCYHATAVLLPDGTVLSAGGGEYRPENQNDNDPADSHRDAQVFSPPYLFKGPRPTITSAPSTVRYGDRFTVGTPAPSDVRTVSWIRLPSVTHSFDESQRVNFLAFQAGAGKLTVTAPASPNACPPGYYMLFLVSQAGVPSVAAIVRIRAAAPAPLAALNVLDETEALAAAPRLMDEERRVAEQARGTRVLIGLTGTCPYGIGACWGGAYEALSRLEGVALVNPVPDTDDSTAEVFLRDRGLPHVRTWHRQFRRVANGTYELRGVEVSVRGTVRERSGRLIIESRDARRELALVPLAAGEKVQWSRTTRASKPLLGGEALAFEALSAAVGAAADGVHVTVTGPLTEGDAGYRLHVRQYETAT